ncbi:hypothetical protein U27_01372 [Candidatus Vecturithrix granuli]|uniref:ATPase n=1 Tax=Vecturithrix granuli TaxID=1499967 RepID=A0A081CA66_VECG1|nr:hypothetical protein U27_01372 [Candidatus Vecturithrix granuli]
MESEKAVVLDMITYLKINGFKSFHNFEMVFTPLTVIAGANASGKSNVFDALQLLARLAETDLKTAFNEQRGSANELFTQYGEEWYADEMSFVVDMLVNRTVKDNWGGEAELKYPRLRYELIIQRRRNEKGFDDLFIAYEYLAKIRNTDDAWCQNIIPKSLRTLWHAPTGGGSPKPFIYTDTQNEIPTIKIRQDGRQGGKATPANAISQTVLGGINSIDFPHAFAAKEEMRRWKFLQLNPADLREPTRQDIGMHDTITQSGKNLAAALYRLKLDDEYALTAISRTLNQFLPNFTDVLVYDDQANKQFIIKLRGEDGREFSSRVLSEGTLRLLALCIFQYDPQHIGLLCFEEPENGIHPFRIETMAHLLKDLSVDFTNPSMPLRQVIVNTHSPVLVKQISLWKTDPNVSLWFSQISTLITQVEDLIENKAKNDQRVCPGTRKKIKLRVSKILPVIKEHASQLVLQFTEQERKLTLAEVIQYLQTADAEKAIEELR